jgi:hypothetical protein
MKIKDLKEIIKDQVPEKNKIGYAPNKPSEKNIGYPYSKLTSNTTGEGIEEQFNFDTITARDKKIIEEVIKVLQTNDNSTVQNVTDKIKEKFKISEIPMLKYEDSLWHQLTKK